MSCKRLQIEMTRIDNKKSNFSFQAEFASTVLRFGTCSYSKVIKSRGKNWSKSDESQRLLRKRRQLNSPESPFEEGSARFPVERRIILVIVITDTSTTVWKLKRSYVVYVRRGYSINSTTRSRGKFHARRTEAWFLDFSRNYEIRTEQRKQREKTKLRDVFSSFVVYRENANFSALPLRRRIMPIPNLNFRNKKLAWILLSRI